MKPLAQKVTLTIMLLLISLLFLASCVPAPKTTDEEQGTPTEDLGSEKGALVGEAIAKKVATTATRIKEPPKDKPKTNLCYDLEGEEYCQKNLQGNFVKDYSDKKSGAYALRFGGVEADRQATRNLQIQLPVKKNQVYEVSVWIQVKERKCYDYLPYTVQPYFEQYLKDKVSVTGGIWCGNYKLQMIDQGYPFDLISTASPDGSIEFYNLGWHQEKHRFRTGTSTTAITLNLTLEGFDGKIWIDQVTLKEKSSEHDEKYLHIPITYLYDGMNVLKVTPKPLSIETKGGKFNFNDDSITLTKNDQTTGVINFKPGALKGLTITNEPGLVILENENVILSLGLDSSIIAKVKKEIDITVKGDGILDPAKQNSYYWLLEAGVLFFSDYSKGMLFSPIRLKSEVAYRYPGFTDGGIFTYSPADPNDPKVKAGLYNDTWKIDNQNKPSWSVTYNFKSGQWFMTSLFPPKEFNYAAACKNRFTSIMFAPNDREPQWKISADEAAEYHSQKFDVALPWVATTYDVDNPSTPTKYPQPPPGFPESPVHKYTTQGPYEVLETKTKARLKELVSAVHNKNMKIVLYMTPQYYYTTDVDIFLKNLKSLVEDYNLDGIYYDGLYSHEPLRSLELIRKTRNYLGDKIYIQHNSVDVGLLAISYKYRVPVFDAYATKLLVGESAREPWFLVSEPNNQPTTLNTIDSKKWALMYCGKDSNTPSMLIPEVRPVSFSDPSDEMVLSYMQPQYDNQMQCWGEFAYWFIINDYQSVYFRPIGSTTNSILNTPDYFPKIFNRCLPITCKDNEWDPGESPEACATKN